MVLKQSERDFQAQLIELVEMLGGLTYHAHDSRREVKRNGERVLVGDVDAKGYPDLTIVTPDRRVLWVELKAGKKQPTDSQWLWLRGLPDHQAYLWHGTDWDDAARIIQTGHHSGLIPLRAPSYGVVSPPVSPVNLKPYPLTNSSTCAIIIVSNKGGTR